METDKCYFACDHVHEQTEHTFCTSVFVPFSIPMAILDQDIQLMSPSDAFFATVFDKHDTNKDKRLDAVEVCVIGLSE